MKLIYFNLVKLTNPHLEPRKRSYLWITASCLQCWVFVQIIVQVIRKRKFKTHN